MNLVLLFKDDFLSKGFLCKDKPVDQQQVRIRGRRFQHICQIHQVAIGDQLKVGLVNQQRGTGTITAIDKDSLSMAVTLNTTPPAPLPSTLILALPRPKMLKRILQTCATMGLKELILLNSYRVEKSYWQTPLLKPEAIEEQLILGLEQARDTVMPKVKLEKRFKPFVEDRLPALCQQAQTLIAHPGDYPACPATLDKPSHWIIGPEGGFIPYEVEKLQAAGGTCVSLGERILRTETAIPIVLSKFSAF